MHKIFKKIHLKDIAPKIKNCYVKLDLKFLKDLLMQASKSKIPSKNKEFAKKIGCKFNKNYKESLTIRNWIRGYRKLQISQLIKIMKYTNYSWVEVEKNILFLTARKDSGKVFIKFPIEINERFGCIIGHILGDGAIDKKYSQIFFSNSNKTLLEEFKDKMKSIFDVKPRIWIQKKNKFEEKTEWLKRVNDLNEILPNHCVGLFYPRICGALLHAIFGKFAYGQQKKITKELTFTSKNFRKSMIKAFFDDEGYVCPESRMIRLYQDNKRILYEFKKLLNSQDIQSNPIRHYTKRNQKRYYFNITGKENFKKFDESISFSSKHKNQRLRSLVSKYYP